MKRFFISLFALAALVFAGCGGGGGEGGGGHNGGGGNNPNFYSVTFYDGGIIIDALTQSVRGGTRIDLDIWEKSGYTFEGWQIEGVSEPFITEYTVTGNTEFHAKFIPLGGTVYQVNFYDEIGGTPIPLISRPVNAGEPITLPTRTKTGYTFQGWRVNNMGSALTGQYTVNQAVSFYAVFTLESAEPAIEIRTVDDLKNMSLNLSGNYKLMNDIILTGTGTWRPIGREGDPFSGSLDGGGFKIIDLYASLYSHAGLFGYLSGTVKNLGVEIATGGVNGNYAGAIAGYLDGGTITDCYSKGSVSGREHAGGIAGYVKSGTITNSYSTGGVSGSTSSEVGGIAGHVIDGGAITNSYSTGSVSGTNYVGGIAGYVGSSTITDSFSTGSVSGSSFVGGIAGHVNSGTMTDSYSKGSVSGNGYVGGIAGYISGSTITNSYLTGSVSGTSSYVGGIAGYVIGGSAITNSYSTRSVSGDRYIGGIAGDVTGGSTITNSYSTGSVSGTYYVGGIAGRVEGGAITKSYSSGSITGSNAGGIVGYINGGTVTGNVAANPKIKGSSINRVVGTISTTNNITNTISSNYARLTMLAESGAFNTSSDGYGISKTDAELKAQAEYAALGWNFASIWHIGEGTDLPLFLWQEVTVNVSVNGVIIEYTGKVGSFTVPVAHSDPRFAGWNTSFDGLGTTLIPGSVIRVTSGFTIYALMKGDHPNYPIEISDAEELNAIRNLPNLHYRLVSDISLEEYDTDPGWTPIGTSSIPFSGSLDGDGFKITDLYINSTTSYMGLFGYLTGAVKNLGVETASGGVKGYNYTGAIAGYVNGGTITNSYSTGSVNATASNSEAGGIAGYVYGGMITDSYSTGSVSGSNILGGIAGYVYGGMITDSYSTGSVSGYNTVGGIAGHVGGGTITNSYSTGSVTGSNNVGGIAGIVDSGAITNSYSTGDVSGDHMGGIAGYVTNSSTITNCYSTGDVRGDYVGGIAGYISGSTITNSYSTGSVRGSSNVGGIAGYVYGNSTVRNNVAANTAINGGNPISRVVGYIYSGTVSNNFANSGMTAGRSSFNTTAANYGVSKTDSELKTQATYESLGWNFASTWHMDEGYGLPRFIWEEVVVNISVDGVISESPVVGGSFTVPTALSDPRFLGWNTSLDGNGTALTPGSSIPVSAGGFTIYAFMKGNRPDQPIEISNAAEFNAIRDKPTLHYRLVSDISLEDYNTGSGWTPIGTSSTSPFSGSLDGDGFKITGLYINSSNNYTGLFGYLTGSVKNLGVETAAGGVKGYNYTGAIAGYVIGTITNSYSTGSVNATDYYVGGIAGYLNGGTITNSYSTVNVNATDSNSEAGGIAGYVSGGTITNCYSTGSVTAGSDGVGGIAGFVANNSTITNNVAANTTITGSGTRVSRVVGYIYSTDTVTNNFANSGMTAGGSAFNTSAAHYGTSKTDSELKTQATYESLGWNFASLWHMDEGYGFPRFIWQEVTVSVSVDGVVTEQAVIGGAFTVPAAPSDPRFLGWNTFFDGNGTALTPGSSIPVSAGFTIYAFMKGNRPDQPREISTAAEFNAIRDKPTLHYRLVSDISLEDYNTGSGWTPIGTTSIPFSGSLDGDGFKITGLYINSSSDYMGLFGYLTGSVKNLGVETAAGGVKGYNYTGAIAGYVDGGTITNCYSTGSIIGSSSSAYYLGGIAGYVNGGGTIKNSYSTVNVNATGNNVGGIAGYVNGGMITDSYSTGSVSGSSIVGGIAGYVNGGMITDSYSTGSVSGSSIVGGIAGYVVNGSTITNNVAANSTITGSGSNVSRVVGYINGTNTISDNFANSGMTAGGSAFNTSAAHYGVSKTDSELKTQATYEGLSWDFASTWHMDEGYGLPRFIWQEVTVSVSIDGIVTEQAVVGGAFTVPDAIADSRFLGWNTSFDGNGIPLTPGYSIPVSAGGFTIYALMKGDHPNYPIEISDAEELNAIRNKPNLHYRLTSDISLSAYNTGSGWTPIGTESIPFSGTLDGDGFKITDLYINSSERYVGLFGYLRGTVKNLGVEIAPGGVKGGSYTGAIAGYVDDGAITSSYSTGNVSGTSGVGGIAGSVNYGTITNCYSTGNINASSSNSYVGGIAGYVYGGMITDSYSTGSVSGSSIVGGITGYVVNGSTITNNVAANSTITGSGTSVSRVVGAIYGTNTVSNNFANSGMTGSAFNTTSANYGISKSLTVLQTQTTYSDTINGDGLGGLGWQFGNDDAHPWKMPSGGTGFPILYWQ